MRARRISFFLDPEFASHGIPILPDDEPALRMEYIFVERVVVTADVVPLRTVTIRDLCLWSVAGNALEIL